MSTAHYLAAGSAAPRADVSLLYISKSRYGGDWHSTPHTHACTELFYCISGGGRFLISGQLYPVAPDDLVVINPQVEHTEQSMDASPLEYIVLGMEGATFSAEGGSADFSLLHCGTRRDAILPFLQVLLQETAHPAEGSETICADILDSLLLRLTRLRHIMLSPAAIPLESGSRECAAVYRYIEQHYAEPLTLGSLAALVHIDKSYLSRTFRREYGMAPIACLLARRIRESKYLLGNTDYTLSRIALLLGFSSLSYFSQRFRKSEQISPNEYRRRARAGLVPKLSGAGQKETAYHE